MYCSQIISLVSLATAALAAPASKCKSVTSTGAVSPTLPSTGSTDLTAPVTNLTLKFLAIGHGIQNYTCANSNASAVNTGALAVLYDATSLYPGTQNTGLSTSAFANITSTVLWDQAIPLNLLFPVAANPAASGAGAASTTYPETYYQADAANPFLSPDQDLSLSAEGINAPFLGHHYFDSLSSPTFNLSGSSGGLFFSGAKVGDVKAPASADKGVLATGAIDWLQLADNGRGLSKGVSTVYRVVTAGGVAEPCSVTGPNPAGQIFSVPYVAEYWFYG